jgi:Na+/proline symporter
MSLLASIMSAATLLGGPVEVYSYGTMYLYWSELFSSLDFNENYYI